MKQLYVPSLDEGIAFSTGYKVICNRNTVHPRHSNLKWGSRIFKLFPANVVKVSDKYHTLHRNQQQASYRTRFLPQVVTYHVQRHTTMKVQASSSQKVGAVWTEVRTVHFAVHESVIQRGCGNVFQDVVLRIWNAVENSDSPPRWSA